LGRIHARGIDDEIIRRFKELVKIKHNKLHTAFGKEIEIAMQMYIDYFTQQSHNTHAQIKTVISKDKKSATNKRIDEIKAKIIKKDFLNEKYSDIQAAEYIKRAISEIAGFDPRTIRSYWNKLKKDLFIAPNLPFEQ